MKSKIRNRVFTGLLAASMIVTLIPVLPYDITYAEETVKPSVTVGDFIEPIAQITAVESVPSGYVIIDSIDDLNNVRNGLDQNYILMADLTFTDADFDKTGPLYNGGARWIPIGVDGSPFTGIFDGNGHKISGLQTYNLPDVLSGSGLFTSISNGGTVKNLSLDNSKVWVSPGLSEFSPSGIVAGKVDHGGSIENCFVLGSIDAYKSSGGGIVGDVANQGVISGCYNAAGVIGEDVAGGIAGSIQTGAIIENCFNIGKVATYTFGLSTKAGGVVGMQFPGSLIKGCYNTGHIESIAPASIDQLQVAFAGGIVGLSQGDLSDCFNTGEVYAMGDYLAYAGGIVGYVEDGAAIASTFNTGIVYNSKKDEYMGSITGKMEVGTPVNSYIIDREASNGYGVSLTQDQMMNQANFSGFDFSNQWNMGDPNSHAAPYLQTLGLPCDVFPTEFDGGNGSTFNPYQLSTIEQLKIVYKHSTSYFILKNDIRWQGTDPDNGSFTYVKSITGKNGLFEGVFDGDGYKIVGVSFNDDYWSSTNAGMFGTIAQNGIVMNLGFERCNMLGDTTGTGYAGSVATILKSGGMISNCTSNAKVGGTYAGGIAGKIESGGIIANCSFTGTVSGRKQAGGIAGYSAGEITSCYNVGSISTVVILGQPSYGGGIVGYMSTGASTHDCYNTGEVTVSAQASGGAGGITGVLFSGLSVSDSYNIGNVTGTTQPSTNSGGIVGRYVGGELFDCYKINNQVGNNVGTALALSDFATQIKFGFDFTNVWKIDTNLKMPVLRQNSTTVYPITYNLNGGMLSSASITGYQPGVSLALPTPTRVGYTFAGWFVDSSFIAPSMETTLSNPYGEMVLYAKWTPNNYNAKFNMNGGTSGTMANLPMTYDVSKLLTTNAFKRTGYAFLGWAKTSTGAVAYLDRASVKNLISTNNATVNLYAKWGAPILSATSYNYNSIKVSWAAAGSATYYKIYRSNSASGTYYLVHTSAATTRSWIDAWRVTGKTYYYKVCPVANGKTYSFSTYKYAKPIPATPTTSVTKYSSTSIKVSWSGVTGASGYQVYRATSATGTYSLVYTGTSTARSWVNTGRTVGSTYYYKVRAYHVENGGRVYGNFSTAQFHKLV
jgi:uncharacterized repeat protein (TIGR02543 family)